MGQLTIRAGQELLARVRAAADARGSSVNGYVTAVLAAATDPDLAGTEVERLRERLAAAGLLARVEPVSSARPDAARVAPARAAAGGGTPLADLVSDGRR